MPRHPSVLLIAVACTGCFFVTEEERAARWDLDGDGIERPADCDDGDPSLTADATFYADTDGDGFGDPESPTIACVAPTGYVATADDCDDADPLTFPEAAERCDGADNDCDQEFDEGLSLVEWFPDADLDGFGDEEGSVRACGRPDGHVASGGDCDDTDPYVHPDADEVCNGIDDDCANGIDEADPGVVLLSWYDDVDGDGYGDDATGVDGCVAPYPDQVGVGGDCRPADPDVNPGADELCNGIDDDCDGGVDVDADDAQRYYEDVDGDGWGSMTQSVDTCPLPQDSADTGLLTACELAPPGLVCNNSDCNDSNDAANPGVPEVCANGIDDDCDTVVDEGDCV